MWRSVDCAYVNSRFRSKADYLLSKSPKQWQSILPSLSIKTTPKLLTLAMEYKLLATPGNGTMKWVSSQCICVSSFISLAGFESCLKKNKCTCGMVTLAGTVYILLRQTGIWAGWLHGWHSPAPDERCVTFGFCRRRHRRFLPGMFQERSSKTPLVWQASLQHGFHSLRRQSTLCVTGTADPKGEVLSYLWFNC